MEPRRLTSNVSGRARPSSSSLPRDSRPRVSILANPGHGRLTVPNTIPGYTPAAIVGAKVQATVSSTKSLTEELEKIEQSITLTLQEIDHNFSSTHRIITGNILPVVQKYSENSQAIWASTKFWKEFFEASANVSLTGYEEPALNEDASIVEAGDAASTTEYSQMMDYNTTMDSYDYERHRKTLESSY
ncbi:DASH complex subunit Ask1-domain-containing protein, partial [Dipodascopsis tothii]|uniref:DASH complex subunit Ask1-domain-containing protein n=1 Tax=Dipodascopsis tothii TaxID=44089 RepID=UPI0034CDA4CF